ncbi:MAG: adenylyltransferase/cytidyltransferase family protein [Pelagibacteraceae bacterium]|nr:adenylyltransferase/cytidyltransferase family protein [Pelagibacteraceae bacterium]
MKKKIIDFSNVEKILKPIKRKGKKIVCCHGVFDLLHLGHIKHFKSAKKYGDILIVSVTPDKFIQKGFDRPYFNSEQRMESLASIEAIDFVILNKSANAIDIINKIKPNYYIKGQDYKNFRDDITGQIKKEKIAVKKNGGKLVFTEDRTYSSSSILNQFGDTYNLSQKKFIHKIKEKINLNNFNKQINKLQDLKVLVIGETIIDKYVFCETLGKSGKEPHLVLRNLKEEVYLGGALAIARNVSDFCKKITILSMLGQEKEYEKYIKKILGKKIKSRFLYKSKSPTIIKKRYLEHLTNNKVLGIYTLNDELLNKKDESIFEKMILKEINEHDVVIVSDYGHGLITKKLAKLLCKNSKFLALNAQANASNTGYHSIQKYKGVNCVVINETELRQELRDKNEKLDILTKKLTKMIGIDNLVITSGSDGALLYSSRGKKYFHCPAFASKVIDKIGAGDSMLSIMSILIKSNFKNIISIFLGSLAGAMSVEEMSNKVPIKKTKLLKYCNHILK